MGVETEPSFGIGVPGSIVVGVALEGADADAGGHADFLVVGEAADVGGLEGVQPADFAALVADDDVGEDGAWGGEGAGDGGGEVGVADDFVISEADAGGEGGVVDSGDIGGGGSPVDGFLEHLHVVVGAVVEDEEFYGEAGAGGGGHFEGGHEETAVAGDGDDDAIGSDALGADGGGDGPAHALVVGGGEIAAGALDGDGFGGPVGGGGHIDEDELVGSEGGAELGEEVHGIDGAGDFGSVVFAVIDLAVVGDGFDEAGVWGALEGGGVGEEAAEEDLGIGAELEVGVDVAAEVVRIRIDVDDCVVFRDGVIGGGDFAIFHAEGENDVDLLEGAFGGAGALLAVTPANGEGMAVGDRAFTAYGGGDWGLEQLGDGGELRGGFGTTEAGIDADAGFFVGEAAEDLGVDGFVEGDGVWRRDALVKIPGHVVEGEGDDDGDRAGLAAAGDPERLVDGARDLGMVADFDHVLDDGAEDCSVVEGVNLADLGVGGAVDVGDDAHDGDAVEEGLADSGEGVGEAWAGDDAEDADASGDSGGGIGHDAGGGFVGDEEVRDAVGLEGVPELVILSAWDAEDAGDAFAGEGCGGGLGAGHLASNADAVGVFTDLDASGLGGSGGGDRRRADGSEDAERFSTVEVRIHRLCPFLRLGHRRSSTGNLDSGRYEGGDRPDWKSYRQ